jgi:SAM-dependent methyltransferase
MLPVDVRRALRTFREELPVRLRDFPADVGDLFSSRPLPPATLRRRVGRTSSRREYVDVGSRAANDLLGAFEMTRSPGETYGRWLDFGCGSGRVARELAGRAGIASVTAVDVDARAIRWARRRLDGVELLAIDSAGPLPMPSRSVDAVIAVSVFTHFDEERQLFWLRELARVIRPGGLLLATTHGPELTFSRPDLAAEQHRELQSRGFLFAPGNRGFREDGAFHSRGYLEKEWGRVFRLRRFEPMGLAGYQDLSVWEAERSSARPSK